MLRDDLTELRSEMLGVQALHADAQRQLAAVSKERDVYASKLAVKDASERQLGQEINMLRAELAKHEAALADAACKHATLDKDVLLLTQALAASRAAAADAQSRHHHPDPDPPKPKSEPEIPRPEPQIRRPQMRYPGF